MNRIKEKALKLNPEFLGHIKLFLDNGSETVKQSITIYYEEPQEDIFKSNEGATPTFKVLSAISKVDKEDIKGAVNSSVQETFEKMGIEVHQLKHSHDHHHEHGHHHDHDEEDDHHHEHGHHHDHDEEDDHHHERGHHHDHDEEDENHHEHGDIINQNNGQRGVMSGFDK